MTNEHYTLGKCVPQLESTLRLDTTAIASYLFSQGFITDSLYEEILDPRSTFDGAEKATKLVIHIMRKVKLEPGNYYKFINHLRQDMRKYGDIVDILDTEYFGIRRLQQPTGQKAVSSDDLHNELTPIKDKWYNIGIGLKIPNECLNKFHCLIDPLMEVIVHWLKGSRDTPPSWEGVVLALKEPGVDEAELAEKIDRLYCDHREEEKAVEEKKEQAPPSGNPESIPVAEQSTALVVKKILPIATITDVATPWGVAINHEGEIVVSEKSKHRVSIFSPQGQKVRSFGSEGSEEGKFKKPCGVAVDRSNSIFVADTKNFRIQKFSPDGTFLKAVGKKGSGDLKFESLRDMVYNTFNNRLYVIDDNRIKVFDSDLSFISSFGKFSLRSTEHAAFNMPVGMSCDSNGQLYVADCLNNRIVVLSPEGAFVKALGGKFHMRKQTFNHPVGVAVDNAGLVYLSQLIYGHNRVSVVTPEGELMKQLDGGRGIEWGSIYTPIGLEVDTSGVLYVCEFNSDRIALY